MTIEAIPIQDLVIINPTVFEDARGYFFEAFNQNTLGLQGIHINFVQDNQSFSKRGTLRGLHYQNPPYTQTKLVRVLEGKIMDVCVDIRKQSPTYGQHFAIRLPAEKKKQLLIQHGFAHGFSVISETAVVLYKCDQYYNNDSEGGIRYDDLTLAIDWQLSSEEVIVSEKDLVLPEFNEIDSEF